MEERIKSVVFFWVKNEKFWDQGKKAICTHTRAHTRDGAGSRAVTTDGHLNGRKHWKVLFSPEFKEVFTQLLFYSVKNGRKETIFDSTQQSAVFFQRHFLVLSSPSTHPSGNRTLRILSNFLQKQTKIICWYVVCFSLRQEGSICTHVTWLSKFARTVSNWFESSVRKLLCHLFVYRGQYWSHHVKTGNSHPDVRGLCYRTGVSAFATCWRDSGIPNLCADYIVIRSLDPVLRHRFTLQAMTGRKDHTCVHVGQETQKTIFNESWLFVRSFFLSFFLERETEIQTWHKQQNSRFRPINRSWIFPSSRLWLIYLYVLSLANLVANLWRHNKTEGLRRD